MTLSVKLKIVVLHYTTIKVYNKKKEIGFLFIAVFKMIYFTLSYG